MRARWVEAALFGTLLGSFLTIPVAWAHLTLGSAFAVLAAVHVVGRRGVYLAVLRWWRRRAMATAVMVTVAVVMTVSGFVQWAGVSAAVPWHGASSVLLLLLAAGHATRRLRRWPARSRAVAGDGAGTMTR